VLQDSKNGLQRFFREKSNQAAIAGRFALKRATEVAVSSAPVDVAPTYYSIAATAAWRICGR
jgi:hypothetical protein